MSAHKAKLDKVPVELTERVDAPESLDWRDEGKVTPVKNQGGCGSCWAFSGTGAIESALLMNNQTETILAEQLYVDCAPNPDSCGGTGGCSGSIQPLLFEYALTEGAVLETDYAYTASTDTCKAALKTPVASIEGYEVLPENLSPEDMMQYLITKGPLAVSVDASSWSFYGGGVLSYSQCGADIDHAVMMVGYGTDPVYGDYWTIKNSWGASWGEDGYIRISREDGNAADTSPGDGTGCADGPSEVTVRGTCGIYYGGFGTPPRHPASPAPTTSTPPTFHPIRTRTTLRPPLPPTTPLSSQLVPVRRQAPLSAFPFPGATWPCHLQIKWRAL